LLLPITTVVPIASTVGLPTFVIKGLLGASLLAAVMPNATKHTRVSLFFGIGLLLVTRFAADDGYLPVQSGAVLALVGVVGLAATAGTLRYVVTTERVDSETIYAALSTYLLGGIFFGEIYWALEGFWPRSLIGPDPTTELTSIYYSFVSLATLGYGDYLPRTDIIRGVATFEVIGGQLYLAVMVARLIGLFVPKQEQS
jgi:hypothetical protein